MADFSELISQIREVIKDNTEQAITGDVLQKQLVDIIDAMAETFTDLSPRCLFYDWEKTSFTQEELVELRTAIGKGVPIIISRLYNTSMIYMRVSMTAIDGDTGAVTFRFPLYSGSSSNQKIIWTIAAGGSITKQTFNSI